MKMNENGGRKNRPGLPMMLLGIAILMLGLFMTIGEVSLRSRSQEVDAEITRVIESRGANNNIRRTVYVQYEVDGVMFRGRIRNWSRIVHAGDHITVLYDTANPERMTTSGNLFQTVAGALFMGGTLIGWSVISKRAADKS